MISLFPKNEVFYELLEGQAEKLEEAAKILDSILKNPNNLENSAIKMKKLEEEADDLGHEIIDHLRKNFITPFEREDINLLRQTLDDIMDLIEKAVNRMVIYRIPLPLDVSARSYIEIIKKGIIEINKGMKEIRNVRKFKEKIAERCQKINLLENEGDEINRRALKSLMGPSDCTPEKNLAIMKLKEIYETLENAIDSCENVGNIFETILIKNS